MKLSLIQTTLAWEDKAAGLARFERLMDQLPSGCDLAVLPEMFNTGFTMNTSMLAETPEGETYEWMKRMASSFGFAVCGSYIVKEGSSYFNRWLFISPEGEEYYYNKRHLFAYSGEDKEFTAGNARLVFSYRGLRIMPSVCYDLRFPVWLRNQNDYDLMINSACWPAARTEIWNTLLRARAIENQAWVAGCNCTGTDGNGIKYTGNSLIAGPSGKILTSSGDEEAVITADLSMDELSDFRSKYPFLKDADNFNLEG